jgi:hypothetical protein
VAGVTWPGSKLKRLIAKSWLLAETSGWKTGGLTHCQFIVGELASVNVLLLQLHAGYTLQFRYPFAVLITFQQE